ncbi:MAG: AAA family ATPase, partial [Candidatus Roizmanbacteria bacterium]|nr:AAA family ATPase [Candidatus Roizmanbacteria bacterium]
KNTIIIMTSNIGSDIIVKHASITPAVAAEIDAKIKQHFKPELLNRIDSIIVFDPLSKDMIRRIISLQLEKVQQSMAAKQLTLTFDASVMTYLEEVGFDAVYGARPVQRLINELIVDELAYQYLEGKIQDGDTLLIRVVKGKVLITVQ